MSTTWNSPSRRFCVRRGVTTRRSGLSGKVDYATLSPEHRQQYDIRMGYIRFQQGDYDDALRYFRRIPSPGEYSDHALYYISYIAYVRGDNAHGQSRIYGVEPFGGLRRRGAVLSVADRVQRG